MHETEPLILGLLVAIPALSVLARLIGVPYPIMLVAGALPLGFLASTALALGETMRDVRGGALTG